MSRAKPFAPRSSRLKHTKDGPVKTAYVVWDDEQDAILTDVMMNGGSTDDAAAALNRSRDSVRNRWSKINRDRAAVAPVIASRLPVAIPERREIRPAEDGVELFAPLVGADAESDDAFLSRIVGKTEAKKTEAVHQHHGEIVIAADKPVGLSFSSDWHLDASGACDVRGLMAYADLCAQTDGLYAVAYGDYTDNRIKHRPQSVDNVPDDLRLFDLLLARFRRKMLAMTTGNHDDWTVAFAGVDSVRALAKRHRTFFAPDELYLTVRIVDPLDPGVTTATWRVLIRHQFRRHSNLNWTHAAWRFGEEFARHFPTGADGGVLMPHVIALGHHHTAAVETRQYPSGPCVAIRTGAWKLTDRHARALGFAMSVPSAPMVILPPHQAQDLHAFADVAVGAQMLTHLRENAR